LSLRPFQNGAQFAVLRCEDFPAFQADWTAAGFSDMRLSEHGLLRCRHVRPVAVPPS
jgi:hypothetical protein